MVDKISLGLMALAASAFGTASAQAAVVVIDFDDVVAPTAFSEQPLQVTDQYAALGIQFGPGAINNRNEILNYSTFAAPPGATFENLLASEGNLAIEAFFTVPVYSVGALIGISAGTDLLSIFDADDNLLDSILGDDVFVSLSSTTAIARFTVTTFADITPAIDNLTFEVRETTDIPAPAALGLIGFGILGVAGLRRRRP